ncbi:recombination regulator RecX [Vogesella indigofera]|uniref:recombination regulator RecX n=1 Tax=Vogesella indigofera TaxID=45465 RepID=UPI00234EE9BA|nr:recombination regulator RecX [Vogesella indigofera]MDC7707849.1 recombination regulator RecX [Vogesella indigofera]
MAGTEKSLKARAVDLLSRREYSRLELKRRLAPFADSEEEVDALLEQLAADHWQSDSRFAEAFANSRGQRYGSRRLAQEMRERGIDRDTIQSALAQQDDLASARAIWQRKFGRPPADQQERLKQMRFLASRGFTMDIIQRILRGASRDIDDE